MRSVGVIVAFDTLDYRWNFQIDDGSGAAIEVTCPRERPSISEPSTTTNTTTAQNNPFRDLGMKGRTLSGVEIDMLGVDLGAVVKVKGGIGEFRGERTITLERISMSSPSSNSILLQFYYSLAQGNGADANLDLLRL